MVSPRTSCSAMGISLLVVTATLLTQSSLAAAARIEYCMRVVPNGQIVTRYGGNWCKR